MDKLRATRFHELAYRKYAGKFWRIFDVTDASSPAAVGPHYRSRAELLGDLEQYAREFGCEAAKG